MKTVIKLIMAVAAAAFVNAGTIETTEVDSSSIVEVSTGYSTDKIWRGTDLGQTEGDVTVVTSFELPVDTTLTVGGNYSLIEGSNTTASDEATELSAALSKDIADYLVSLSYTWYSEGFDRLGVGEAQELGLSVSREIGSVTLTLSQYLAVQGNNNGYSEVSLLHSNNLNVLPFELDFTARVGYLTEVGDFSHAEIRVSADLPVVEGIIAQPFVAFNTDLGGEFVQSFTGDNFFGGIQFKRSF